MLSLVESKWSFFGQANASSHNERRLNFLANIMKTVRKAKNSWKIMNMASLKRRRLPMKIQCIEFLIVGARTRSEQGDFPKNAAKTETRWSSPFERHLRVGTWTHKARDVGAVCLPTIKSREALWVRIQDPQEKNRNGYIRYGNGAAGHASNNRTNNKKIQVEQTAWLSKPDRN